LKDTIKVLMHEDILNKVKFLCKNIDKVEWSGVLFYSMEGTIQDPANMVITLQDILPMNKGNATYTEYNLDDRYMDYLMEEGKEERLEWKMGHIHSHNTMPVYFSGTDMSELQDNSASHNFYLSLIVNNYMDFCAKVAFRGGVDMETEVLNYYALDENGEKYAIDESKFTVKKEKLYIHDCIIESPRESVTVDSDFAQKVNGIIEAAKVKKVVKTPIKNPVLDKKNPVKKNPIKQKASQIAKDMEIPFENLQNHTFFGEDDGFMQNTDIENFLIAVLRNTNPADDTVSTIEEALMEIEDLAPEGTTPEAIAKSLLEKYTTLYSKHYEKEEDDDHFVMITEEVIEMLEEEEVRFPFISRTIMALKYMVEKFEEALCQ